MKRNYSFDSKITGMRPPLCPTNGGIKLSNSEASCPACAGLRFRNWSFTIIAVFAFIALGLGTSDCATAGGYFYNIDMRYDAVQAVIPEYLKAEGKARNAVISVAEFIDTRQMDDKREIGRVRERNDERSPVFPKNVIPTRAVANGIKAYLKKAGYKVADKIVQWDLKEETLPNGSGKIIIGGSIDELEVTCWRGVFSHSYKTNLKLTIVFADLTKNKIIYKSKVESAFSRDDVSFSEEQLGQQASTLLGDAIEKVFKEKDVAQKIKEVIVQ